MCVSYVVWGDCFDFGGLQRKYCITKHININDLLVANGFRRCSRRAYIFYACAPMWCTSKQQCVSFSLNMWVHLAYTTNLRKQKLIYLYPRCTRTLTLVRINLYNIKYIFENTQPSRYNKIKKTPPNTNPDDIKLHFKACLKQIKKYEKKSTEIVLPYGQINTIL